MAPVELAAAGVATPRAWSSRRSVTASPSPPSTRSAASIPDTSTIGTPTPGTVPTPANTSAGRARVDVARAGTGRSGRSGATARTACPAPCPARSQSSGSTSCSTSMSRRVAERGRRVREQVVAARAPLGRPVDRRRRGSAPAPARTARGGPAGPSSARRAIGTVTRIDGSGIRRAVARAARRTPRPTACRSGCCGGRRPGQARPARRRATPAHDGE